MRPVSAAAARVTAKVCSRKFIALGRVLRHWPDIVGPELASKAQPVRLTYRRTRDKKPAATLYIAARPAQASLLHYQTGLILERINRVFGERWVERVRFVPGPEAPPEGRKPPRAAPPPAVREVEGVADPDLRAALARLGGAVLQGSP
jgi:hypothetical protein